jgi:dTDP-4-amino-4,6-dideoxygalactose transaminase
MGQLGLAIGSSTQDELASEKPDDYMKAMDKIQERQLVKKLKEMDEVIELRKNQKILVDKLLASSGFRPLILSAACDAAVLRYPIKVGNKEEVLLMARQEKIQIGDWFNSPVHPNLTHWDKAGYLRGCCPVAEKVSGATINIPLGPHTSEQEIIRTVGFLERHAEPVDF